MRTLLILLCAVLSVSAQQTPEPKKLQALILTGQNVPGHDWRRVTPLLRKALEDTGQFEVRVTEDADRFTIDRVEPGRRAVRFYAGRSDRDITDEVLSGTYRTARLDVGASSTIRLEVAVPPTAASGADRPVTLRATISGSPETVDTARALVHVR